MEEVFEVGAHWGRRRRQNPKKPWASIFTLSPCRNRCRFSEIALFFSQMHPPIKNKIDQKIRWRLAKVAFDTVRKKSAAKRGRQRGKGHFLVFRSPFGNLFLVFGYLFAYPILPTLAIFFSCYGRPELKFPKARILPFLGHIEGPIFLQPAL